MGALRGSADLLAVVAVAAVGMLALTGRVPWSVRIPLGVLFVLLAPGYALVSLLLPAETVSGMDGRERVVSLPERLLLGLGLSLVIVPLLGIGLHYYKGVVYPWDTVVVTGSATVLLAALALGRRVMTDPNVRMATGVGATVGRLRASLDGDRRRDAAVNVALAAALVVAAAGVGLAVATTDNGERYTEFYLLTDAGDGTLVADGYPSTLTVDEPTALHVGIANHEGERATYTVVVQLQRVERTDGRSTVTEQFDLDSFEVTVDDGRTVHRRHAVTPPVAGESFRLTYLLFEGDPGQRRSTAAAYRSVHIWVDVAPVDGASS